MKRRSALLVIDVQLDFCPGGALPVPEGDAVIPILNRYLELFLKRGCPIFASRDWHPEGTSHFKEFGGVWPRHCVQESEGALFHPKLKLPPETIVISKGHTPWEDGYSALQGVTENGTPFPMLLKRMEIDRLYVGGLATDYCVKESVLGALEHGFVVCLLEDAIRGVDVAAGDSRKALAEMQGKGAELVNLEQVTAIFTKRQ